MVAHMVKPIPKKESAPSRRTNGPAMWGKNPAYKPSMVTRTSILHSGHGHDLCHYRGMFRFDLEGEAAACELQCRHLIEFFGDRPETREWCAIVRAEVIGQAMYFRRQGQFPDDQEGFVRAYLGEVENALDRSPWAL
jgi:hypothetical protein